MIVLHKKMHMCIYIQAMERLLIEQFIQDENIENYKPEAILSLINSFTRENFQLALKDNSTLNLIKKYKSLEINSIRVIWEKLANTGVRFYETVISPSCLCLQ